MARDGWQYRTDRNNRQYWKTCDSWQSRRRRKAASPTRSASTTAPAASTPTAAAASTPTASTTPASAATAAATSAASATRPGAAGRRRIPDDDEGLDRVAFTDAIRRTRGREVRHEGVGHGTSPIRQWGYADIVTRDTAGFPRTLTRTSLFLAVSPRTMNQTNNRMDSVPPGSLDLHKNAPNWIASMEFLSIDARSQTSTGTTSARPRLSKLTDPDEET